MVIFVRQVHSIYSDSTSALFVNVKSSLALCPSHTLSKMSLLALYHYFSKRFQIHKRVGFFNSTYCIIYASTYIASGEVRLAADELQQTYSKKTLYSGP